jgi:pyruvate/2-oxoglutarate dehydrogenase complex dihydrolipoamide dehydrogenase (E3) component
MAERIEPDICVIGGGSAGLSVAAAAAVFGVSVVLVEKGKTGGSSLNNGCMPSKALIAAARRASAIRHSAPFGVTARAPAVEFGKVHAHLQRVPLHRIWRADDRRHGLVQGCAHAAGW